MAAAIFGVLAALPQFLELAEKLGVWIFQQVELAKIRKLMEDLNRAESEAKEKKDTSRLDELFDPGKKK